MAVNAVLDRPMTVSEFLDWQQPDGRRYQLIDGHPVAMAPGSDAHGTLVQAIGWEIRQHPKRRGRCCVVNEAGVIPPTKIAVTLLRTSRSPACRTSGGVFPRRRRS